MWYLWHTIYIKTLCDRTYHNNSWRKEKCFNRSWRTFITGLTPQAVLLFVIVNFLWSTFYQLMRARSHFYNQVAIAIFHQRGAWHNSLLHQFMKKSNHFWLQLFMKRNLNKAHCMSSWTQEMFKLFSKAEFDS